MTVHPLPTANIAGDNEICLRTYNIDSDRRHHTYGAMGRPINRITVSPSVQQQNTGDSRHRRQWMLTAAYTVTVHSLPTANIAGDNEICLGGHTTLTATGGTSYLWSNGETTNWITVSPSATTEYSVTVTDGNGCQATAVYTVTVHPLPTANIAGDNEICL
ncbi:MAG: hypothetical protein U0T36_00125 [Saprospiraceae bacterium]